MADKDRPQLDLFGAGGAPEPTEEAAPKSRRTSRAAEDSAAPPKPRRASRGADDSKSAPKARRSSRKSQTTAAAESESPPAKRATGRAIQALLAGGAASAGSAGEMPHGTEPEAGPAVAADGAPSAEAESVGEARSLPAAKGAPAAPASPSGRGQSIRDAIRARLAGERPATSPRPGAERAVYSVGELAQKIKRSLEQGFGTVYVQGEISNLRQPGSGHLYFTLKDEAACLRAVLFRSQARLLKFRPENGQEVIARGRVTFYDASGDAQIVCDSLEPVGAGALALAFAQLKERLGAEGLFDPARKRTIPFLPKKIGVVTSPTGAAIRDFLRVLHRRHPQLSVLVAPARVQGEGAAAEIASGVRRLAARGDCDVIVVTRGGGSLEDLWAFNEEVVARAIAASPIPVVSAVGHEVDFTIADFVADLRAPTPTAAAELLAPVEAELREGLATLRARLARAHLRGIERRRLQLHRSQAALGDPRRALADRRLRLETLRTRAASAQNRRRVDAAAGLRLLQQRLRLSHPAARLKQQERALATLRQRLADTQRARLAEEGARLADLRAELQRRSPAERVLREGSRLGLAWGRLQNETIRQLERRRARLDELRQRLQALSPLRVLARGYSVAFRESGLVLLSAEEVEKGERLHLELPRGALLVEVLDKTNERKAPGTFDPEEGGS